jgi:aspartyl aminopeptidase
MNKQEISKGLAEFIDNSVCSYYTVDSIEKILKEKEFKEYDLSQKIELKSKDKGYFKFNDSTIIAFDIASENIEEDGFRIIGSHTDSPTFKIKSNPIIKDGGLVRLNTEVYGGPIFSSWLDRPLSIAGRVTVRSENILKPKSILVNIDKDLLTISNLCIHMNRDINKGFSYDPQSHMLPILTADSDDIKEDYLNELIAEEIGLDKEDILDYDLYLYDRQKASMLGPDGEFISVGRQDNLTMAYTSLMAFVDSKAKGVNLYICTDNEEVGSMTYQGADSQTSEQVMKRIALGLGKSEEEYLRSLDNSFMISADMAHALHPAYKDKVDPTNIVEMGKGPVIKYSANKSYSSDAFSAAVFKDLCKKADVPYQSFYNKSGAKGGSTIGPISSKYLRIHSVDIGNPILGMHSVRELGSNQDNYYAYKVFLELFNN